jgi:hypothetical protein
MHACQQETEHTKYTHAHAVRLNCSKTKIPISRGTRMSRQCLVVKRSTFFPSSFAIDTGWLVVGWVKVSEIGIPIAIEMVCTIG